MQTLASIDLKPALVRGEVRRLLESPIETEAHAVGPVPDYYDMSQPEEIEAPTGPDPNDTPHEPPTAPAANSDDMSQDEQASADDNQPPPVRTPRARKRRSSGPYVANGKDPWGDEEIKKLIKWKVQGMTHKEAGVSLNSVLSTDLDWLHLFCLHTSVLCRPGSAEVSPRAPSGTP